MGTEVCRSVFAEPDLELVAAIDPGKHGQPLSRIAGIESTVVVEEALESLKSAGAEVAVDFTTPSSVVGNIKWCLENSVHAVVGTTGITGEELEELADLAGESSGNVIVVPNFAIGAVLMMRFAELAARWLPEAEIIELHHAGKLDSPSGTSLKTAGAIARGKKHGQPGTSPEAKQAATETVPGARGADQEGLHIHSVRLPGLVAHQEVIFGGPGQTLTIRHDSIDRSSFMPGVLLAIRQVPDHPGLTIGLETLLGV